MYRFSWRVTLLSACALTGATTVATAADSPDYTAAESRARATVQAMEPEEKVILTHGILAIPLSPTTPPLPADAVPGAGYVPGIPRLGIPPLTETDASLGVAYAGGLRKDNATALPSGLSMASSWNPELLERGGRMIGSEARAKGYNVMLAGGVNLMRDPRNGRNFEYLGEDPLLAGTLVGHAIRGIQSNNIIATIKHLGFNGQETGRHYVDVQIEEGSARESDLLAFQIGMEIGQPGSVMCAYNRVRGEQSCASDWMLNKVLKQDWGFKGFVMSDWGAVPNVDAAQKGLDQQSGEQLDTDIFFGEKLAQKAAADKAWARRLDDMNVRILTAMYALGLDKHPPVRGTAIDYSANADVAEDAAKQGIVLLRNERDVLPLAGTAKNILIVGGLATNGVLSGGGSSQVIGEGGPAASIALGGTGLFAPFQNIVYHRSSPFEAIKKRAPEATVRFRNGRYISEAVTAAKSADLVIVFANQWSGEGFDQPDLSLPDGQDALVEAVASANPNTVVVLQTGGPVLMPWLDKTAAVIEAWYPGIRGGDAIAAVLFGETNPSGRLPITFPASEAQLPRPQLDGFAVVEPDFIGRRPAGAAPLIADFDVEGSDVGYRWHAKKDFPALFPFGFGLSYTTFETSDLRLEGLSGTFKVRNTGSRSGAAVAQLYLTGTPGGAVQRLAAFQRVELKPGETRTVTVAIDPRIVAEYQGRNWVIAPGTYRFSLGSDAERLGPAVDVRLAARKMKP